MVDISDLSGLQNLGGTLQFGDLSGLWTTILASILIFLAIGIIFYLYFAIALMSVARKTNTLYSWFAFIPILNLILMAQVAQVSVWTVILAFIPFVNIIVMIWWWWKIAKARGRPGWWAILLLIPVVNLIILGVLAWGGQD